MAPKESGTDQNPEDPPTRLKLWQKIIHDGRMMLVLLISAIGATGYNFEAVRTAIHGERITPDNYGWLIEDLENQNIRQGQQIIQLQNKDSAASLDLEKAINALKAKQRKWHGDS